MCVGGGGGGAVASAGFCCCSFFSVLVFIFSTAKGCQFSFIDFGESSRSSLSIMSVLADGFSHCAVAKYLESQTASAASTIMW